MRAKGFVCPSLANIFRPSTSAPADPAVIDVANAIYRGGRTDGVPGLEAVAHVIQNRCRHPSFPCEPHAVVLEGTEQFADARHGGQGPLTSVEKQLFNQAKRLATQLMQHPHRLPFPDPTGGAIYYDQGGPAALHSAVRPFGPSGRSTGSASSGLGVRSASRAESLDPPSEDDVGAVEPPRASPQKSRRPLSFFRDRGVTGTSTARGSSSTPAAGGASQSLAPPQQSGRAAARGIGTPAPQPASQPGRAAPGAALLASGDHVPANPSRAPVPTLPPPQLVTTSAASSGGLPGVAVRPLSRPMLPGRGGPMGLAPQHPHTTLHRAPSDEEGYQDLILPCGLFQDEVIEIMYRDLKPEDFDMLNKLDERVPKRNIVQRNLVDRLPRCMAADCGCSECGVCLAELSPGARVVQLPCRHGFHPTCISRWLTQCKNTCPLCSAPIDASRGSRAQEVARSHEMAAAALAGATRSV
mmetsp:Transcript_16756/g.47818  ORF Transcript_16756/g.47818 Transcript_16756/m.47818 type:complete len:469 (-) Transcript_16756:615-2021(-)